MIFKHIPLGLISANTYVLADEDTKEGVIVDVGGDFDKLQSLLEETGVKIQKILLTHGHLDHMYASNEARHVLKASVYIHENDKELYKDSKIRSFYGSIATSHLDIDGFLRDDDILTFGKHSIRVIHTPGHTQGSVSFLVDDSFLLSGDTLFRNSIGRTDHMGGDMQQEIRSIKEKILILPGSVAVFPGHGRPTSIEDEKKFNSFLQ